MGFSSWDWAVFVGTLAVSLGTGLAAGWIARRKVRQGDSTGTAAEFLTGGRTLNPLAVALSTMVGAVSAVTLLGNAAEMYAFGTQLWMNHFGLALGFVFVHLVNLKVLYPLGITSVFTLAELLYSKLFVFYNCGKPLLVQCPSPSVWQHCLQQIILSCTMCLTFIPRAKTVKTPMSACSTVV